MKFIDLFSGIGGFRLALEKCGNECVFSSEIDEKTKKTYFSNFGENPNGDITKISEHDIPSHDIICAGFPCQPFSSSGKRLGFEDARGTLLYDILRIAKHHRPKVLLLENVRNFISHHEGKTLSTTLRLIKNCGYDCYYKLLNSSLFGVPQKRERVYFVCFHKDLQIKGFNFPDPSYEDCILEDVLVTKEDYDLSALYVERDDLMINYNSRSQKFLQPLRVGQFGKGRQGERIYSTNGHAVTISAFGGGIGSNTGLYYVGERIRRLHPIECLRLMTFPDDYKLPNNFKSCYQQIGNAVVVHLIRIIFKKISKILSGELIDFNNQQLSLNIDIQ